MKAYQEDRLTIREVAKGLDVDPLEREDILMMAHGAPIPNPRQEELEERVKEIEES